MGYTVLALIAVFHLFRRWPPRTRKCQHISPGSLRCLKATRPQPTPSVGETTRLNRHMFNHFYSIRPRVAALLEELAETSEEPAASTSQHRLDEPKLISAYQKILDACMQAQWKKNGDGVAELLGNEFRASIFS